MKIFASIILVSFPIILSSQNIKKIDYRGETVYLYPSDSIFRQDNILMKNLPDGTYLGFLRGDTTLLQLRINYVNNLVNGPVITYNWDHQISSLINYKDGKKNGHWIEFSLDTILHEGDYVNDKREGFVHSYAGPEGSKSEYNKSFYRNDTLIYNIWYKYDSIVHKGDTGYVFRSNYTRKLLGIGKEYKGKEVGLWKYYHENGNPKSIGSYDVIRHSDSFSESRKNGKWIDYHENGQISREYLCDSKWKLNDNIISVFHQYDSLGNELDNGTLKNGFGVYKEFYPDGSRYIQAKFSNQVIFDYYKQFYPDGRLQFLSKRNKDQLKQKFFYPSGKLKSIEISHIDLDNNSDILAPPLPGRIKKFNEPEKDTKVRNNRIK